MTLRSFAWNAVLCGFIAASLPTAVFSQTSFAPQGGEYAIAGGLPGDQTHPAAAINAGGGYLVWQDNAVTDNGLRIRAERLGRNLASADGTTFVVSALTKSKKLGDQEKPQVALLQGGGAVFVWQCGKAGAQQIYARFMNADGTFDTKDLRVSAYKKNNQMDARVATLADGDVVVVWSCYGVDGSMLGVFARLYSSTGKPLGNEFQVNQFTANNQRTPTVAALANGNFVVTWISEMQSGPGSIDVFARIFNSSGVPAGDEFQVDQVTNNICANPSVTGSPQGGFAVAWSLNENSLIPTTAASVYDNVNGLLIPPELVGSTTRSTNGWDVAGRLFDAGGNPLGDQFRLNQYTFGDQFGPTIVALGSGYMAVWSSLSQPDPQTSVIDPFEGVFGQFINGSGGLVLTNDVHVNTATISRQIFPVVVSDGASRFLALWSSVVTVPGSAGYGTLDVMAQQYSQAGGQ